MTSEEERAVLQAFKVWLEEPLNDPRVAMRRSALMMAAVGALSLVGLLADDARFGMAGLGLALFGWAWISWRRWQLKRWIRRLEKVGPPR